MFKNKNFWLIIIFLIFFILLTIKFNFSPLKTLPNQPTSTTQPLSIQNSYTITFNNQPYTIYWQSVSDFQLSLIPNFNQQLSSKRLLEQANCQFGSSAGYYTPNKQPLGLFYTAGQFINDQPHQSLLTNGFISFSKSGQLNISETAPVDWENLVFAFQAGPLFTPDTKLTITNDEPAKRILAGKNEAGEFYLLAIVETDNSNSGPMLSDLPGIIDKLNTSPLTTDNQQLTTLLNLDGGSASAFYSSEGVVLGEITAVGSFLCGYK